jgi:hypothetical protein
MNLIRGITAEVFQAPFVVYTWDTDALDMPKSIVKFGGYD